MAVNPIMLSINAETAGLIKLDDYGCKLSTKQLVQTIHHFETINKQQ